MRIALGVEYLGTSFSGWQAQRHARSVQGTLEEALSYIADQPVQVTCAGRTDAGVHAIGQVVHFDTAAIRPESAWTMGTNTRLPADVGVRWAMEVTDEFHARFSARSRTYRYVIHNARLRSPLLAHRAWWFHGQIDIEAMREGVRHLLGEHDFSAFRAAECQARTPVRRVLDAQVTRHGDLVCLQLTANAFLHHMVRNVTGTLVKVGSGEADPGWVADVLEKGNRSLAGMTAPAGGLYLVAVDYGDVLATPVPNAQAIPGGVS